jgi:hypothetical protein
MVRSASTERGRHCVAVGGAPLYRGPLAIVDVSKGREAHYKGRLGNDRSPRRCRRRSAAPAYASPNLLNEERATAGVSHQGLAGLPPPFENPDYMQTVIRRGDLDPSGQFSNASNHCYLSFRRPFPRCRKQCGLVVVETGFLGHTPRVASGVREAICLARRTSCSVNPKSRAAARLPALGRWEAFAPTWRESSSSLFPSQAARIRQSAQPAAPLSVLRDEGSPIFPTFERRDLRA